MKSYATPDHRRNAAAMPLRIASLLAIASTAQVPAALAQAPDTTASFPAYLGAGLSLILPAGQIYIVFLLALFLASPRTGPLLTQVVTYMAGHSLTLWLVATGVFTVPQATLGWLVPASVLVVAVENLLFGRVTRIKPFLVFAFGLIHGMAFAIFYRALSADGGSTMALVGFNLGLEIAVAAVIGLCFAASLYFRGVLKQASRMDLYRPMIVVPVSLAIAVAGLLWTL